MNDSVVPTHTQIAIQTTIFSFSPTGNLKLTNKTIITLPPVTNTLYTIFIYYLVSYVSINFFLPTLKIVCSTKQCLLSHNDDSNCLQYMCTNKTFNTHCLLIIYSDTLLIAQHSHHDGTCVVHFMFVGPCWNDICKHVEYISGMTKDLELGRMHDACKETHLRLAWPRPMLVSSKIIVRL